MDAFFAAVEERDHRWLKGKPIVVGADPMEGRGRGVVSTANYPARAYGITSAMPISHAWRANEIARMQGKPLAVFVGVDSARYHNASERIITRIRNYVPLIEQASIDEAYLDLTFAKNYKTAATIARRIKKDIVTTQRLTCSIGIGPNKLIAKIASDFQKPDGLTVVKVRDAAGFLEPLPIRILPGIGPKTEILFRQRGIATIHDLKKFTKGQLRERIGNWAGELYEKARGRDDRPVTEEHHTKSVGGEETFLTDVATENPNSILKKLEMLCGAVSQRMHDSGFHAFRTIIVTVRLANFETLSRSRTITKPETSKNALLFEAMRLLMPFLDRRENPSKKRIRLIGVRIEKLS